NQIDNYNRCVDSAVADGVLTLEAANDEGCTGFSSKLEKKIAVSADALSDGGSLTVDLNIGSWSNLVGNNDYIGITIANQDETGGVPAMSIGFAGGDAIQCFSNLAMGGSVATSLDDNPCDLGATVSDTPVVLRLVVTSPNGQGKATPYYKIGDGNFVQLGGGNGFSWKSAMEFSIAISTGINGPDNFGVVIDSINVTVPALPD
ncbi:MAG: hypothetical protein U1D33_01975, partial [bacterium]|nr:hypothetical protein [bacterium]